MRIYTYCSYRGSHYGYQYSSFNYDSKGSVKSMLSEEMHGHNKKIPGEFIKWCENKNGWQLVLEKVPNKDKYLIMVGQLEKSREFEKKKRKSKSGGETDFDENSLDSDFYMTFGFYGTAVEIKPLIVYLLKQYKDGFRELFNKLEETIKKSEDAKRYEIDTSLFNGIFSSLDVHEPPIKKNSILGSIVRRIKAPDIYLSVDRAKDKKESLQIRNKNVDKCVELLSNIEGFSEHILLLIAYEDFSYFNKCDKVNIRIDYEYLC